MTQFSGQDDKSFVTKDKAQTYTELFFASIFAQDKAFEFSGRREHG